MNINEQLDGFMGLVRGYFFPEFYGQSLDTEIKGSLIGLIYSSLNFSSMKEDAEALATRFMGSLPEVKRLLMTDVDAILHNDPAVTGVAEVVLCYPAIVVMTHYRTAHALYEAGVPLLPRMISERAHSATGVDIHPAARIGEYFAIDHGTGVVVGATCIIGNHVMLYQGVTLGAKHFKYDENGLPIDLPRHPILEDNVTVYSNTSILGRVHIGHDTTIGGNVWLTHDVPANSLILQSKAVYEAKFTDGAGI